MSGKESTPAVKEWIPVTIIALCTVFVTCIPYLYGYAIAPEGKTFMGDARCFMDVFPCMAWMRQAADGQVLFSILYTTEPHQSGLFHPFYLLLGTVCRCTGLSVQVVYSGARVILGFVLLILCYRFISFFLKDRFQRTIAFVLLCFSGGFRWLSPLIDGNRVTNEAWFLTVWTEGNTFLSIYSFPLFIASLILMILTFLYMLRAFEEGKILYSVYAAVSALFLIFIHPYDAFIVYPVTSAYLLVKWVMYRDTGELKRDVKLFLILLVISLPAPLYAAWAATVNPVFHEHSLVQARQLSPHIILVLGSFGFMALFGLMGALKELFHVESGPTAHKRGLFLATWFFLGPFLIYAPFIFQRRLIEGFHIACSILAATGLFWLIERFRLNKTVCSILFIALVLPANPTQLYLDIKNLNDMAHRQTAAGFLDNDILEGMQWIRHNTAREDRILCDYEIGNYIPALTGNRVFIGHSPLTMHFGEKNMLVRLFFAGGTPDDRRREILKTYGLTYVFYTFREKSLGTFDPLKAQYLKEVFKRGGTTIFAVVRDKDE